MPTATDAEAPQFPLNTVGPKGEHAFLGSHRFRTWGATGSISATMSAGMPGVTATRIAQGRYRLGHPRVPTGIVDAYFDISAPSGLTLANVPQVAPVKEEHQTGATGTIDFIVAQGTSLINPATGTTIKVLLYVAPISPG